MNLTRGDIHWIDLPDRDPKGAEIEKRRPCVILSLTGVNAHRKTVVVVPLTTKQKDAPPILISVPSGGVDFESRLRPDSGRRQEARSREGRVAFTKRHETPRGERQPRVGVVIRNSRSAAQITILQVKCMQIRSLCTYPGDACATSRAWREAWERGPHWRPGLQRGAAALAAEARAVLARLSGGAVNSVPG